MEVLQEAPKSSTFIALSEHQSATPASFYSGPPVLHYHSGRCKIVILERDLSLSTPLAALARQAQDTTRTAEPVTNGNGDHSQRQEDEPDVQKVLDGVDVWVTSEYGKLSYPLYGLGTNCREGSSSCSLPPPPLASQSHIRPSPFMQSKPYLNHQQGSNKAFTCSSSHQR